MNWEEIPTEDRPVTFVEWATIARFGGTIPKGEHWIWDFPTFDAAWECYHKLCPQKFKHFGLRLELRNPPLQQVWTVRLHDIAHQGRFNELAFRAFPVSEKMNEEPEGSLFSNIIYDTDFERLFVQVFLAVQKAADADPTEKLHHCCFLFPEKMMKPDSPKVLMSISRLEVR